MSGGETLPGVLVEFFIRDAKIGDGGVSEDTANDEAIGSGFVAGAFLKGDVASVDVDVDQATVAVGDGIVEGDFVFVDPQAPFIDGGIYVIRIAEMVMVKHVYIMDLGRYKLVLGHGEIEVDHSEIEILGRLTGSSREH